MNQSNKTTCERSSLYAHALLCDFCFKKTMTSVCYLFMMLVRFSQGIEYIFFHEMMFSCLLLSESSSVLNNLAKRLNKISEVFFRKSFFPMKS